MMQSFSLKDSLKVKQMMLYLLIRMQQSHAETTENLRNLHDQILSSIDQIELLDAKFHEKQQKQYLSTFMNVMDRMSSELVKLQQNYRNIDRQIESDEKCVHLSKELAFFKAECLELQKQLSQIESQVEEQAKNNKRLQSQKAVLQQSLFSKIKQSYKYRSQSKNSKEQTSQGFNSFVAGTGLRMPARSFSSSEWREKTPIMERNKRHSLANADKMGVQMSQILSEQKAKKNNKKQTWASGYL